MPKEQMQTRFAEHFKDAEELIEKTGYHRRDAEFENLRGFLTGSTRFNRICRGDPMWSPGQAHGPAPTRGGVDATQT